MYIRIYPISILHHVSGEYKTYKWVNLFDCTKIITFIRFLRTNSDTPVRI